MQNGTRKNQIEEAIEVAAEAHQGQYRKGTRTPYITHPYAVGLILMGAGCSRIGDYRRHLARHGRRYRFNVGFYPETVWGLYRGYCGRLFGGQSIAVACA